jgi:Amt family ammonium transporter
MFFAVDLIEWLRVDDPVGAVAVHGACGIWGTLSVGLFASGYGLTGPTGADNTAKVEGLFYGGGFDQLKAQLIGSATVTVAALAIGFALMYAVKATGTLRVSEAGELEGLDIHEHGGPAYRPEFAGGGSYVSPLGAGGTTSPDMTPAD